MTKTALETQIP